MEGELLVATSAARTTPDCCAWRAAERDSSLPKLCVSESDPLPASDWSSRCWTAWPLTQARTSVWSGYDEKASWKELSSASEPPDCAFWKRSSSAWDSAKTVQPST